MNFLEGSLERRDGGLVARGEGFELAVDASRISEAWSREGREQGAKVLVGVRPHDLRLAAEGETSGLGAEVDVIEPMGWEALLYATLGRKTLVAHGEAGPISALAHGQQVRLTVSPDRLHLFDLDTERSLAWS